jgi:hypothetical protein
MIILSWFRVTNEKVSNWRMSCSIRQESSIIIVTKETSNRRVMGIIILNQIINIINKIILLRTTTKTKIPLPLSLIKNLLKIPTKTSSKTNEHQHLTTITTTLQPLEISTTT